MIDKIKINKKKFKKQRRVVLKSSITHTNLTGRKGLGSGLGLLLNCLIISLMLEVGSGFGLLGGGVDTGSDFGGDLGGFTERVERHT